jgi:type II secretory pathway pseudopilin PulG
MTELKSEGNPMNKKTGLNLIFKKMRFPAFTIAEIIIVILVVAVVGGVAISAFLITFGTARRAEDQVIAAQEVEYAMNALRLHFTNIGLGMPNNSGGTGSFNISFTGYGSNQPIMAYMGDVNRNNRNWGGPVTRGVGNARDNPHDSSRFITTPNANGVYAGEELFYAWAVPTNVRLSRGPWGSDKTEFKNGQPVVFGFLDSGDVKRLTDFSYDFGRHIGISNANRGASLRSWILFPSFRIPLLIDGGSGAIDEANAELSVTVSPYSDPVVFEGYLHGYEEVHLLEVSCIFSDGNRLIQRRYDDLVNFTDRVLAHNVLGVYFVFDNVRRILTMYTVARGNSPSEVNSAHNLAYLSSKLPSFVPITFMERANRGEKGYRVIVENMTWRIRN